MNNELMVGIEEDVKVILSEMVISRNNEESKAYKCLTDSLEKMVRIHRDHYFHKNDESNFYKHLHKDVENEINEIRTLANIILQKKDYREYRQWTESFARLISLVRSTTSLIEPLVVNVGIDKSKDIPNWWDQKDKN